MSTATYTATDMFCGAGGTSLGASLTGRVDVVMAANHWDRAIQVHERHFPAAVHYLDDISQADPRAWPRTHILYASPECTNHSLARGVRRSKQQVSLFDDPDPKAQRSRATMWDVVRFAEQMRYDAVIVENVVEASKWVLWNDWRNAMASLGYDSHVVSANSQDFQIPQSRDRIFIVFWRTPNAPDLALKRNAYCARCDDITVVGQAWKNGRTIGRYRTQWVWRCTTCHTQCQPELTPAETIIDRTIPCPRIGDRKRPLAPNTRRRIAAGAIAQGWTEFLTAGAGNVDESTPGNRSRPLSGPLPTQTATSSTALVQPPAFLFQTAHGGRSQSLDKPLPTVCASDDRPSLVVRLNGSSDTHLAATATPIEQPIGTVAASGNHYGLLTRRTTSRGDNPGHLTRPTSEPIQTVTTTNQVSLLLPYRKGQRPYPTDRPLNTLTTHESIALLELEQFIDDCGFRMLQPHEIAAAMGFPPGYIPLDLPIKDQVKLAGNAVTPPIATWLTNAVCDALDIAYGIAA